MIYQDFKKIAVVSFFIAFSGCSANKTEENSSLEVKKNLDVSIKNKQVKTINNKVSSKISSLVEQHNNDKTDSSNEFIKTKQSQIQVYLIVRSTDEKEVSKLKELGLDVEIVNAKLNKIQAWVNFSDIYSVAELNNVITITTPSYASPRTR